ncbi:MAG: hypothetical protein ACJAXN_003263 [Psychromonas sp.]
MVKERAFRRGAYITLPANDVNDYF